MVGDETARLLIQLGALESRKLNDMEAHTLDIQGEINAKELECTE